MKSTAKTGDIKINDFVGCPHSAPLSAQVIKRQRMWRLGRAPETLVCKLLWASDSLQPETHTPFRSQGVHNPTTGPLACLLAMEKWGTGAYKIIGHGAQRQKQSWAERESAVSHFSLDHMHNRPRTSSQITRAWLLGSSWGFFTWGCPASPGRSLTYPNNRKREVESTNPQLEQGKSCRKSQPESKAMSAIVLK